MGTPWLLQQGKHELRVHVYTVFGHNFRVSNEAALLCRQCKVAPHTPLPALLRITGHLVHMGTIHPSSIHLGLNVMVTATGIAHARLWIQVTLTAFSERRGRPANLLMQFLLPINLKAYSDSQLCP